MQFTRLRLVGFKSFVDPAELVIAPGLTGVVGPNGCGKSNLVEALRWVMGENRAKSMRGTGMDDVIFAGSRTRPARNHAEVTLTIDNRERLAPAAFNEAVDWDIVRRISRDAGSAYRANGKEARARDVQLLFADGSSGARSPALVGQGRITELVNAKPTARRRVLEDAAGISGLYQRRHEAELKLSATETNLARVADLLETLRRQLASLTRQAKQAKRYREIGEALRAAETRLLLRLWRDAEAERIAAAALSIEATRNTSACVAEAARLQRLFGQSEEALPALREEDAIAGALLQRLTIERDRLQTKTQDASRNIERLEAQKAQVAADLKREAALNSDAEIVSTRLLSEQQELESWRIEESDRLTKAQSAAEEAAHQLQAAEATLDTVSRQTAHLLAEHQAAHRALKDAHSQKYKAQERLDLAEAALSNAQEGRSTAQVSLSDAGMQRDEAAAAAAAANDVMRAAEAELTATQESAQTAQSELSEAQGTVRSLEAEIKGLNSLLEKETTSANPVLDQLHVEPGFEAALGAALGESLFLPLVDPNVSASGWQTTTNPEAEGSAPSGETLADRVSAPPALQRALRAAVLVAAQDGPKNQKSLANGRSLVSQEGDIWRWDGLYLKKEDARSEAAQRLTQRNRLTALVQQRDELRTRLSALQDNAAATSEAYSKAKKSEAEGREIRKLREREATSAEQIHARAQTVFEAACARAEACEGARASESLEAAKAQSALTEAQSAAAAVGDPSTAEADLEVAREKAGAARSLMLDARAETESLRRESEARAKRLKEILVETESWKKRRSTAADRIQGLERRARETQQGLTQARAQPGTLEIEAGRLAEAFREAEVRQRTAADALSQAETTRRTLSAELRSAEGKATEAREARARLEVSAEAADASAREAAERIQTEFGQAPEDLAETIGGEIAGLPSKEKLEVSIRDLTRQRENLGGVNLRAEQDSRELETEETRLLAEQAELEEAIQKLRHGITRLNREGRDRLLKAYEEVNQNFGMLFRHLFGGGEARLILVESDDPLEAGLEIMCQPPGKNLSSLSLLSGGEQTLTALSMLFAVFLANPSPICVLDEVDAPLDDANVKRFCDLLDEMTGRTKTRFLIITHNAITMGRMDRLFGVTMAEQGVSRLVSVDLATAEEIVEAQPA
ncbi:MAG: chromosome segregation protein SMC [Pseudomonadota bacterium]